MPKQIEFDGTIHEFPDDFTDADIAAALGGGQPPGPRRTATPPPPQATIGMMQPSTMQGDPKRTEPYLAEEWAGMPAGERLRNVAQWGAKALLGGIAGPTGIDAAEHPKTTLLTAALPVVAQKAPGIVAKGLGVSKARAGGRIQGAIEAGKDVRVPMTPGAQDAALRARELTGSRNAELNNLFDRLTNPKVTKYRGDDLLAQEAQDFIAKFGAMSADDALKLPPAARGEITTLVKEMRSALTGSLEAVGKGEQYARGVREYRRAGRLADLVEKAQPYLKKLGYAAAAGAGYKGLNTGQP